jgi:hypothetical protein
MLAEQLITDAIVLNEWIKENQISIRDCSKVFNHYYENIVRYKFQNDIKYFIRLTKKLKYERI